MYIPRQGFVFSGIPTEQPESVPVHEDAGDDSADEAPSVAAAAGSPLVTTLLPPKDAIEAAAATSIVRICKDFIAIPSPSRYFSRVLQTSRKPVSFVASLLRPGFLALRYPERQK